MPMLQFAIRACAILIFASGIFIMFQSGKSTSASSETVTASGGEEVVTPEEDNESTIDTAKLDIRLHPKGDYPTVRNDIELLRADFQKQLNGGTNEDSLLPGAGKALEDKIVNALLPHWYGTAWDFNGITDTPGVGQIACGYLVSTVLKHCGFNFNRYTLAQQSSWNEARTLQLSDEVKYIKGDHEHFAEKFKEVYAEGFYLVGLDNHVGFILLRKGELLFIHSSYYPEPKVVIEKIGASLPFQASRGYYIAEISTNKKLLKKWITQEKVEIRKDKG